MGRPKGSKDSKPRKRRTQRELAQVSATQDERIGSQMNSRAKKVVESIEITPLQIMLASMEYYWLEAPEEAKAMFEAAKTAHEKAKEEGNGALVAQTARDMLDAFKALQGVRDKAVACAKDAAPFCHRRLAGDKPREEDENKGPAMLVLSEAERAL